MSWFKSLFAPATHPLPEPDEDGDQYWEPVREPSETEIEQIEGGLRLLVDSGIVLGPMYDGMSLRAVATEIGSSCEWIDELSDKGLAVNEWAKLLLVQQRDWDDYDGFNNAVYFQDLNFDGADANSLNQFIRRIVSLAGNDWQVEKISCGDVTATDEPVDFRKPVPIVFDATPEVSGFDLVYDENFESSLIGRLNERLPPSVNGRFAMRELEGSLVVVYLPADKIEKLNAICGDSRRFEMDHS